MSDRHAQEGKMRMESLDGLSGTQTDLNGRTLFEPHGSTSAIASIGAREIHEGQVDC